MSFYTSLTGLNSATAQLGVTSNNIANVGTTGFKRSRADFGDIFSTSPLQKSSSNIGQGVSLKQVSQEFSQGNVTTSGNSLDLAITGDGFFPLRSPDGLQEVYTRNGSFQLNDQNNVVNSAGQRLLAAAVDSSGKADLSKMSVLTIPSKTSGQAKETTSIQLGLNLPADSDAITAEFDRSNPATYNKSTALTVYDGGGNGYLATVYYVKTQNASPLSPQSKWQTHVFVGDTRVAPALMQATDKGEPLYVNKYGELKPESEIQDELTTGKTLMFSLDDLTDLRSSLPAAVRGTAITPDPVSGEIDLTTLTGTVTLSVDGSADVAIDLSTLAALGEVPPEDAAEELTILFNRTFGDLADESNQRYGLVVKYDSANKQFTVLSGTTGDESSIALKSPSASATSILGLQVAQTDVSGTALRGKTSEPAVLHGAELTLNNTADVSVNDENRRFSVVIDGVRGTFDIFTPGTSTNTTMGDVALEIEAKINSLEDAVTGKPVRGVKVDFVDNQFVFTTGTAGDTASIKVVGSADWGLDKVETARGATSSWVALKQFAEEIDGVRKPQFIDENGEQTSLRDGFEALPTWSPIFLDKGELSFNLSGKPISPATPMLFKTVFLEGGKGALTVDIDFTQSTQFSSPFAVLSQAQDGAPEGDLMGLDIGVDGLVNANYSNGSQQSLGKIILANFSSPTGLRQVGDASYLSSATSGTAKFGEAGSAGFGTIRAGATERANVDLTQELVDLITAQRNFQANAKAIETSSTMTQAIINIRA